MNVFVLRGCRFGLPCETAPRAGSAKANGVRRVKKLLLFPCFCRMHRRHRLETFIQCLVVCLPLPYLALAGEDR